MVHLFPGCGNRLGTLAGEHIMQRITDFDLKLLRVFKVVADCGGFSASETTLDMNLSSISKSISDLEERLGFRLCDRGRAGFQLTAEGAQLYSAMDALLMSIDDFRGEIGRIKNRINGELLVGMVDNTISDLGLALPQAFRQVKQQAGRLFIKIEIKSLQEIEAGLLARTLNIGIGPFRDQHPQLVYHRLHDEVLNLYCGATHCLASEENLHELGLDALKNQAYVARGYLRELKIYDYIDSFNIAATVQNMEAVATLILSGEFIGFLPEHYAQPWVESGQMRLVSPTFFSHLVPFYAVHRKDADHVQTVQAFVDLLAQKHN